MAGYSVAWANEFIEEARNTYALNHPDTFMNGEDIRKVSAKQIFDEGKFYDEIDVLEGSPPCASFSMAGSRSASMAHECELSEL